MFPNKQQPAQQQQQAHHRLVVPRQFQPSSAASRSTRRTPSHDGYRRRSYANNHPSSSSTRAQTAPWNKSEGRAVLIGVATFLLLQVGVQYRSLFLWEEMQQAQQGLSVSLHSIESKLETGFRSISGRYSTANPNNKQPQQLNSTIPTTTPSEPLPLPTWMEEYFAWHEQERAKLTRDNYKNDHKLLIVRCLETDASQCGLARHRLQSLPLAVLLAHQSRRLLFIRWEQPAPLQEFLVPPFWENHNSLAKNTTSTSTLDWRFPDWLHEELGDYDQYPMVRGTSQFGVKRVLDPNQAIVTIRHMSKDHGKTYYNLHRRSDQNDDPGYELVFRSFWHRFFTPSAPVEQVLQRHVQQLQLIRGEYTITHIPPLDSSFQGPVQAALDCTKQLVPTAFINGSSPNEEPLDLVVVAPSKSYIDFALEYTNNQIVALRIPEDFLSLDKDDPDAWKGKKPADYYQAFSFLFLLSYSHSVIFQYGDNDGRWASILSMNPTKSARYTYKKQGHCHPFETSELSPPLPTA